MAADLSKFPVRMSRKVGLSPWASFLVWAWVVGIYWAESLPGAKPITGYRFHATPKTHGEFVVIATITTVAWIASLLPIFPVTLEIDERGITKTVIGREKFYPWSDIVDIRVTETGGFRGRGGTIRFLHRGEVEHRKPVDISPGMFRIKAADLAALIRKGIDRWGAQSSPNSPARG